MNSVNSTLTAKETPPNRGLCYARKLSKEHERSVNGREMNHTTANTTLISCGFAFLPLNPAMILPDLFAVFIVRIVVNLLTCPLIILLNILVMVVVKTKRQLRTKSNIALACLATTDLVVGLVVQPLLIASSALLFEGKTDTFCSLTDTSFAVTRKCVPASLYHLFLISLERYIAVKHPFTYQNKVTEGRIIIVSGLVWAVVILLPREELSKTDIHFAMIIAGSLIPFILFPAIIFFNVSVYKEVRRAEKQIATNQVSLEAKEKLLNNKKALYTTIVLLLAMILCYIPVKISNYVMTFLKKSIPSYDGYSFLCLVTLLPVVNSLFNPLIYAARMRCFRVAIIQLLSRKTISQAEELERKIFGPRQLGVATNVQQRQHRGASREEEEQGNETMNNEHDTTVRTQPQEEYEETAL